MNKFTLVLLAAALVTVPFASFASADQSKADCENTVTYYDLKSTPSDPNNPNSPPKWSMDETKPHSGSRQPWAGYQTTKPVADGFTSFFGQDLLWPCEGEHWDGQDSVSSQDPGHNAGCGRATSTAPNNLHASSCMSPNPNQGGADVLGNGQPVTFRVSYTGAGNTNQAYVGLDIMAVGKVGLYQGSCMGGSGLEGASACRTGTAQDRTAVYLRDNTPGNVLAQVVSAPGITKGYVSEEDCDQTAYQSGAMANNREICGRDNTAITVESVLP